VSLGNPSAQTAIPAPLNVPHTRTIILRHTGRALTHHELLAKAWKAASDKARELGWIVQASASVGAVSLPTLPLSYSWEKGVVLLLSY